MKSGDELARRKLLKKGLFVVPAVVSTLTVKARAATPSCSPNQCGPGVPCLPTYCTPYSQCTPDACTPSGGPCLPAFCNPNGGCQPDRG